MEFDNHHRGVQLTVFGDGLPCLFDARVQAVVAAWRGLPVPDAITPAEMLALLDAAGAVPSEYHARPGR
jgi:hypothetical protein